MAVTAKVKLQSVQEGNEVRLVFVPDYQDGRNAEWAIATPALSLDMHVLRSVADAHFEMGKPYTLTITPTED